MHSLAKVRALELTIEFQPNQAVLPDLLLLRLQNLRHLILVGTIETAVPLSLVL